MGEDGYYGVKELRSWQFIKAIQELDAKISAGAISGGFWFSNSAGIITTNNILDLSGQGIINTGYIASANWKIKEDGTIEAKKVVAEEFCWEEVCVNKEMIKNLLQSAEIIQN